MNPRFVRPALIRAAIFLTAAVALFAQPAANRKTENIIFVMADGLRWQEVFTGADGSFLDRLKGDEAPQLKKMWWRSTPGERRQVLMPFVWTVLAREGQIYGSRDRGSDAYVTNGFNFSYPGYSETLCGFADKRIDSNDKIPNPNVTVLEWLNQKPAFRSKIAAFGAWDTFPAIINAGRAGFPVVAGYDPLTVPPVTPRIELLNEIKARTTRFWGGEPFDSFTFFTALEYLKEHKPRVLFISFGETDEWSHSGDYPHYLESARLVDSYLKTLWDVLQAMPEYRGRTSLVFSTDHGRGAGPENWKDHGEKTPESKYIWMAFLGPDTPTLGERSNIAPVTQNQIAATVAALLGEDYAGAVTKAGKPIADALPAPKPRQ